MMKKTSSRIHPQSLSQSHPRTVNRHLPSAPSPRPVLEVCTSVSSPNTRTGALASPSVDKLRFSLGSSKNRKGPFLIVKKKSTSPVSVVPSFPLFSVEKRSPRYKKSSSEEELLNVLNSSEVVLPLPQPDCPLKESSMMKTGKSEGEKIAELERKLKRLGTKYKKLEASYRSLLVRNVNKEVTSSLELDRTGIDSMRASFTPRRLMDDDPIVEVFHILSELKLKVEKVENSTSAIWSVLSRPSASNPNL